MKAVFLDRDGTIATDVNYCCRVEDFKIFKEAPGAIRRLNESGYKVVVVTNQSGVARGYFNGAVLQQIHDYMEEELDRSGAVLDGIYCCPHHPDDGCDCRKPKPGLLLKAAKDLGISLRDSFMVGDSPRDIEAGKAAGCRTVLVTTGPDGQKGTSASPDFVADSLLEAARWIAGKF